MEGMSLKKLLGEMSLKQLLQVMSLKKMLIKMSLEQLLEVMSLKQYLLLQLSVRAGPFLECKLYRRLALVRL